MTYKFTIDALNDVVSSFDGDELFKFNVAALNDWCIAKGGLGGHRFTIHALNELSMLYGGTGGFRFAKHAYSDIAQSLGAETAYKFNIYALNEIVQRGGGGGAPFAIADQSLGFGALTLSGAGGVKPVTSGTPAGDYQISGGQSANYSVDASGFITPASDGAATDGDSFTYGDGTTSATITISATENIYSARKGGEIDDAVADHVANGSAAATIAIRPGVTISDGLNSTGVAGELDDHTFLNLDFSAKPLTLTSEDTDKPATIQNFRVRVQGSKSIYITHLKFRKVGTSWSTNTTFIHDGGVAADDIRVQYCDFQGLSDSELNAAVAATGSDLPWYLFDWFGYFGSDVAAALALPTPITLAASTNCVISNNTADRTYISCAPRLDGSVTIEGNDFKRAYYDLFNFVAPSTAETGQKLVKDNTVGIVFGARWDAGSGPHGDAYQVTGGYVANAIFDGNVAYMGEVGADSNGNDLQGQFTSNGVSYDTVVIRRCLFSIQSLHGISLSYAKNIVLDQCTIIENDPSSPVGQELKPQIRLGSNGSDGVLHVRDCITANAAIYTAGGAEVTTEGNVLDVNGDVSAYYDGPFSPSSRAEAIAAFTPKVGSTIENVGAVTSAGAIRTGNRPPSVAKSPTLTASGTTISVTPNDAVWDGGDDITSQDLRYSLDESTWTVVTGISSPQDIADLEESTNYYVQTRDVNSVGNGPWSKSASIATEAVSTADRRYQGAYDYTTGTTQTYTDGIPDAGTWIIGLTSRSGSFLGAVPTSINGAGVTATAIGSGVSDNNIYLHFYLVTTTEAGDIAVTFGSSQTFGRISVWAAEGYTSAGLAEASNKTDAAGGAYSATLSSVPDAAAMYFLSLRYGGSGAVAITADAGLTIDGGASEGGSSYTVEGSAVKSGTGDHTATVNMNSINGTAEFLLGIALPVAT